jgi:acyl-coenzyme A synthetase/AMP-(fatty) acid ligase
MGNPSLTADVAIPSERRRAYVEAGYWDDATLIRQIDHWAATTPDRVAIVDLEGGRRRSFRQVQADSCKVAGFLSSFGVTPGDVVSVQLPNWYETVVIGLGALRLGAVVNPLVPVYGAKELRLMLDVGQPAVIFTPDVYRSSRYAERVQEAVGGTNRQIRHVMLSDPHMDPDCLGRILQGAEPVATGSYSSAAEVSELIFTSGTESVPKAILHTEQTTNFGVREWTKFLGIRADDVVWMPMPIGHSTGFNYGMRLALFHGLKFVLQDRWDPEVAVRLCESEGVTTTGVSPTHLLDMLGVLRANPRKLTRLRYFGVAGAPIPLGLVEAAAEFGIVVLRGYGSSEHLTISKNHPRVSHERLRTTDGQILPRCELELRRDDGQPAGPGQEGEVFVRSPSCCVGFAPVPGHASRLLPSDGWIPTGDIAVVDADRYLTIIGRKKEIIIRGGMNVAPREIEELLLKHPLIDKASVIGLPDPRLGETVCACVVPRPGVRLDSQSVVSYLKEQQLAPYKLPSRVEFLDSLPSTETGKVKKPELVARVISQPQVVAR